MYYSRKLRSLIDYSHRRIGHQRSVAGSDRTGNIALGTLSKGAASNSDGKKKREETQRTPATMNGPDKTAMTWNCKLYILGCHGMFPPFANFLAGHPMGLRLKKDTDTSLSFATITYVL
jgi:hypothetical protein